MSSRVASEYETPKQANRSAGRNQAGESADHDQAGETVERDQASGSAERKQASGSAERDQASGSAERKQASGSAERDQASGSAERKQISSSAGEVRPDDKAGQTRRSGLRALLRGSLHRQIMFLMMLVIVIPVAAVGIFYYHSYRQSLLADAGNTLREAAAAEAATIRNNLEGAGEAMRQLNYSQEFLYFLDGSMRPSAGEQQRFLEDLQAAWLGLRHTYPNLIESMTLYTSGSTEGNGQSWKLQILPMESFPGRGISETADAQISDVGSGSSSDTSDAGIFGTNGTEASVTDNTLIFDTDEIQTEPVRRIDNSSAVQNVTVENGEALVLPICQVVSNLTTGAPAGAVEMNLSLKNLIGARALVGSGRSIATAICSGEELVYLGGAQDTALSSEALQNALFSDGGNAVLPDSTGEETSSEETIAAETSAGKNTAEGTAQNAGRLKIGEERYLICTERIADTSLMCLTLMPEKRAVGAANRMIWRVGLLALAAAAVMLFVTYLLLKRALRRLTVMDQAMASVERGEFRIQLPPDGYRDEISRTKERFNQMTARLDDAVQNMIDQENAKKDAELRALQAQINPHFLFNIIETMHMQCEIDRYTKVGDGLASLGGLMRYSMRWEGHAVPFRQEWEQLENYIALMQLRMDDDLRVGLRCADGLEQLTVPKMFLQPLVENSFQHGFKGVAAPWELEVEAFCEEDALCGKDALIVRISDNGCGVPPDMLPDLQKALDERQALQQPGRDRQSIGLVNVLQRMDMVCGPGSRIEIHNGESGGINIRAVLPVREEDRRAEAAQLNHESHTQESD